MQTYVVKNAETLYYGCSIKTKAGIIYRISIYHDFVELDVELIQLLYKI